MLYEKQFIYATVCRLSVSYPYWMEGADIDEKMSWVEKSIRHSQNCAISSVEGIYRFIGILIEQKKDLPIEDELIKELQAASGNDAQRVEAFQLSLMSKRMKLILLD